jgi:hypothetical protein
MQRAVRRVVPAELDHRHVGSGGDPDRFAAYPVGEVAREEGCVPVEPGPRESIGESEAEVGRVMVREVGGIPRGLE